MRMVSRVRGMDPDNALLALGQWRLRTDRAVSRALISAEEGFEHEVESLAAPASNRNGWDSECGGDHSQQLRYHLPASKPGR
jgi:hypothetical protein